MGKIIKKNQPIQPNDIIGYDEATPEVLQDLKEYNQNTISWTGTGKGIGLGDKSVFSEEDLAEYDLTPEEHHKFLEEGLYSPFNMPSKEAMKEIKEDYYYENYYKPLGIIIIAILLLIIGYKFLKKQIKNYKNA